MSEKIVPGIERNPFNIRLAISSDLPSIRALDSECFPQGNLDLQPAAAGELEEGIDQASTYVAEDSGDVVGMMQLDRRNESDWELLSLAITEKSRGQGLGKLLMRVLSSELQGFRVPVSVTCVTSPNNRAMQHLLEQFNFKKSDLLSDYFGPEKHRIRYQLEPSAGTESQKII